MSVSQYSSKYHTSHIPQFIPFREALPIARNSRISLKTFWDSRHLCMYGILYLLWNSNHTDVSFIMGLIMLHDRFYGMAAFVESWQLKPPIVPKVNGSKILGPTSQMYICVVKISHSVIIITCPSLTLLDSAENRSVSKKNKIKETRWNIRPLYHSTSICP